MDKKKNYRDFTIEEAEEFLNHAPNASQENIEEVFSNQTINGLKNLLDVFSQIINNNQRSVEKVLKMYRDTIRAMLKQIERDDLSIEEKKIIATSINDTLKEAREMVKDQEEHDLKVIQIIGGIALTALALFLTKVKFGSSNLSYLGSLVKKL